MDLTTPLARRPTSLRSYQYQPLPAEVFIRVLCLHPSASMEDRVKCTISHKTLQQCQLDTIDHFSALSYVWGDAADPETIELEGYDFQVTRNLDSALRHIRDSSKPRDIWVDAICINQSDSEEKSIQVRMMWQVYQAAHHTLIYLGDASSESDVLIRELNNLKHIPLESVLVAGFQDILQRPWFSRVWILQELAFSRDPWVHCGKQSIHWDMLQKPSINPFRNEPLYRELHLMNYHRVDPESRRFRPQIQSDLHSLAGNSHSEERREFIVRFKGLVLTRRGRGVQDPRDMVFAHVNLAGLYKYPATDTRVQELFSADYKKSCAYVYQEIVKFIMTENPVMVHDLLADAESMIKLEDRKLGLATWTVDWSESSSTRPRKALGQVTDRFGDIWCNPKREGWNLLDLGAALLFYGYRRGILVYVSSVLATDEVDMIKDFISASDSLHISPQDFQSSLKVLVDYYTQVLSGTNPIPDEEMHAEHEEAALEKYRRQLFTRLLWARPNKERYESFLFARRWGLLQDGTWALVPAIAQRGDDVCCFEEVDATPFLLRKTEVPNSFDVKIRKDYNDVVPWLSEKNYVGEKMTFQDGSHFHFIGECFMNEWEFQDMKHRIKDDVRGNKTPQKQDATQKIVEDYQREAFVLH
ncbi:hypothetical protein GLAREA_10731 [Glarea lozoyensis ATCC 20868]|uniref:Heterokaryon incompatibility domain-containing protein n=1 Tax=Glarea lozoyensis (strain ATCC 20868 / MF5171) TaxID=1116229 RepID=S3DST3_GLAL2|nr:uncharacterized protein GLAREA_10731 [Glarea lozoyensis ATCC 20868]EPE35036.1 hypothetical protein GLAREA_10731 [Glarea lozoyensis ATCC 20868]